MTLRLAQAPIDFPSPDKNRENFEALLSAYSISRNLKPDNKPVVAADSRIMAELLWCLGYSPELLNEIVMIWRLFLYEDVVKIMEADRSFVVKCRECVFMTTGVELLDRDLLVEEDPPAGDLLVEEETPHDDPPALYVVTVEATVSP